MLWYDIPNSTPFHIDFISFQFIIHHFQLKEHKIYMRSRVYTHTHTHTDVTIITTNKHAAAVAAFGLLINSLSLALSICLIFYPKSKLNWLEQIFGSFGLCVCVVKQSSASHQIYNTLHAIHMILAFAHSNFDFNWISNDTQQQIDDGGNDYARIIRSILVIRMRYT